MERGNEWPDWIFRSRRALVLPHHAEPVHFPLMQINETLPDDVIYSLETGHSKMYDTGSETVARKRVASDDDGVRVPACRAPRRAAAALLLTLC